ncbi:MAG: TetR/AcrR family transcriptional regulator [Candidatus Eremiobacteraeota bacterium]|nr:TetR/AcrR family transcriptional regulator [Candidatus Eremiobacteraeota bacterium]
MAPRPYTLKKRAQLADDTRRRILDAIVQLHAERGVAATTAGDIAARADVAVATVSRYFPSIDDMVQACGAHLRAMVPIPTGAMFDGADDVKARVHVLVARWFAFHEGLAPWSRHAHADAGRVPALHASLSQMKQHHETTVRLAFAPFDLPELVIRVAIALTGPAFWRSIVDTGVHSAEAGVATTAMLLAWMRSPSLTTTTGAL